MCEWPVRHSVERSIFIPVKHRRWYVKRVEAFISAYHGRKIKRLTAADMGRYVATTSRRNRLSGPQFFQCNEATRILHCGLWVTPVWRESDDHRMAPGVARRATATLCLDHAVLLSVVRRAGRLWPRAAHSSRMTIRSDHPAHGRRSAKVLTRCLVRE